MDRRRRWMVAAMGGGAAAQFLLDKVGSAASALALRKLSTSYAGSCLRLRRDSDNAESDFGFASNGGVDDAAIVAWLAGANGFCVTWYDQSGNGNNFSQSVAGSQPKYVSSGIASLPDLLFDGVDDLLIATNFLSGTQGAVFSVLRMTGVIKQQQDILASGDEATAGTYFISFEPYRNNTWKNTYIYQKNNDTTTEITGDEITIAAAKYQMMWKSDGSAYTIRVNEADQVLTVRGGANDGDWFGDTPNRDNVTIGAGKVSVTTNFLKADVSELVVYDNVEITSANIAAVEADQATWYGPFLRFVAFGDSIANGLKASSSENYWRNIVASNKRWTVINGGINGTVLQNTVQNTVSTIGAAADNNGRDTYTTRVNNHYPDYVLILYGLNDLRLDDPAFSETEFETDLGAIIDGIVANGTPAANIVIGSPPYMNDYTAGAPYNAGSTAKHEAYVAKCAAVATAKSTKYIDVYQWMIDNGGDTLVDADGIHPNDAGHAAIADAFLSVL